MWWLRKMRFCRVLPCLCALQAKGSVQDTELFPGFPGFVNIPLGCVVPEEAFFSDAFF